MRTPGANTGDPNFEPLATLTPLPNTTASPTPTPTKAKTPAAKRKPVTAAEKKVIKGWSEQLRHGHVTAAARYFSLPTLVSNATPGWLVLETLDAVKEFNAALPCGAKLISTRRSAVDTFVVGTFKLTERPGAGSCGAGTGDTVAVAFMIRRAHITRWVRDDTLVPSPTATPDATATATPSATATPTETPSAEATPTDTPTAAPTGVPGEA